MTSFETIVTQSMSFVFLLTEIRFYCCVFSLLIYFQLLNDSCVSRFFYVSLHCRAPIPSSFLHHVRPSHESHHRSAKIQKRKAQRPRQQHRATAISSVFILPLLSICWNTAPAELLPKTLHVSRGPVCPGTSHIMKLKLQDVG